MNQQLPATTNSLPNLGRDREGYQNDLALIFNGAYNQAQAAMERIWARLREDWLRSFKSPNTRRAYRRATDNWLDFLATQLTSDGTVLMPWLVEARHVRGWIDHLNHADLSPATINQRLAACSSWYSFITNERHLINGIERTVFLDANGNPRQNPFHANNVQRPDVTPYRQAHPLSVGAIGQMLAGINTATRSGARNHALLLTIFLTGWRVQEALNMTWGRIRPSRTQPGAYIYQWSGKGDKTATDPLPNRAYHAIIHYLKHDGRWAPNTDSGLDASDDTSHIQPHHHIWQPLATHGLANLRHGDNTSPPSHNPAATAAAPGAARKQTRPAGGERGPISAQTANRILRTALRNAGIKNPAQYRIHDLRHSLAHAHYQEFRDLRAVQQLLHHASSAVTDRYLQEINDPIDTHSEILYQKLLL